MIMFYAGGLLRALVKIQTPIKMVSVGWVQAKLQFKRLKLQLNQWLKLGTHEEANSEVSTLKFTMVAKHLITN